MLSSKNFVTAVMRTPPVGKVGCGWSPRPGNSGNADRSRGQGFSPVSGRHGSVHRRAGQALLHPRFVGLYTQPSKDIHHCRFSGLLEGSQGYVLGLGKKGFGLSHTGSLAL